MILLQYLAKFCALIPVLVLHEFAHAFVAYKCGDNTAKWAGRLTLNPAKHFDLAGLLLFAFAGFGWAKPVPINPYNFKHYKRGLFLTAGAGVAMNLLLAFFSYPLLALLQSVAYENMLFYFLYLIVFFFFSMNLSFFVFNLIPLYPLDGFRIWDALDRKRSKPFRFIEKYGYYILMGLIIESFICDYLSGIIPVIDYFNILGFYLQYVIDLVSVPIRTFWGLFI